MSSNDNQVNGYHANSNGGSDTSAAERLNSPNDEVVIARMGEMMSSLRQDVDSATLNQAERDVAAEPSNATGSQSGGSTSNGRTNGA